MFFHKLILFLFFLAPAAPSVFALSISFGGGPIVGYTFNKLRTVPTHMGFLSEPVQGPNSNWEGLFELDDSLSAPDISVVKTYDRMANTVNPGGYVFADFNYGSIGLGYVAQIGKAKRKVITSYGDSENVVRYKKGNADQRKYSIKGHDEVYKTEEEEYFSHYLFFDALGRFPLELGSFTLSPALGVSMRFPIEAGSSANSEGSTEIKWALDVKFGVDLDLPITDNIFIRGELLFGVQVATDDNVMVDFGNGKVKTQPESMTVIYTANRALSVELKIAVGYRLELN
jgi:hypothetical protein